MSAQFYKYQALGNDMIVIDPAHFTHPLTPATIRLICDRHRGVGADGLCYGPLIETDHPYQLRYFNPDGSESRKSGNGLRVFARYLWDAGYVDRATFEVWMGGIAIKTLIQDEAAQAITMTIGALSFESADIPVSGPPRSVIDEPLVIGDNHRYHFTAVSVGNPHCVIFVETGARELAQMLGPLLETDGRFPERTNVQFVRVLDPHTIQIEIWERGAGYTLASGTSASAAAGAAIKTGRCRSPVEVRMAGGMAQVEVDSEGQVTLTGPVEAVSQGIFAEDLIRQFDD